MHKTWHLTQDNWVNDHIFQVFHKYLQLDIVCVARTRLTAKLADDVP